MQILRLRAGDDAREGFVMLTWKPLGEPGA